MATYDLKPAMSAPEVCRTFLERWPGGDYALAVVNLANLDMVGHTGVIAAAVEACRVVDDCVGQMVRAVLAAGGRAVITADHGNAEEMLDAAGGPRQPQPIACPSSWSMTPKRRRRAAGRTHRRHRPHPAGSVGRAQAGRDDRPKPAGEE